MSAMSGPLGSRDTFDLGDQFSHCGKPGLTAVITDGRIAIHPCR